MKTIEIEEIAELLNCSKQAAWAILKDPDIWQIPHCGTKRVNRRSKRYWDRKLVMEEIKRINELRLNRHWKTEIINRSYVMVNESVRKFPSNKEIREFLIKCKGFADYRAYA